MNFQIGVIQIAPRSSSRKGESFILLIVNNLAARKSFSPEFKLDGEENAPFNVKRHGKVETGVGSCFHRRNFGGKKFNEFVNSFISLIKPSKFGAFSA
jgi:hypothetical protein